jgi:hypothetical protein
VKRTVPARHGFDLVTPTMAELASALRPDTDEFRAFQREEALWRQKGRAYGTWVLYPERNDLAWYPTAELWELAQTVTSGLLYRDFGLTGSFGAMRQQLRQLHVAVAGCSVGWRIIDGLTRYRVGSMKVADRKPGAARGNNRAPHTYWEITRDTSKALSVARRLHAEDPFLRLAVYSDGLSAENISAFVGGDPARGEPAASIVFDEMDDLAAKLKLRRACKEHRVAYAMISDVGPCALVDFHDWSRLPELPLVFGENDTVCENLIERLAASPNDLALKLDVTLKLVGGVASFPGEIGRLLTGEAGSESPTRGFPQDGSTCMYGGVLAARLLLAYAAGKDIPQRRLLDPETGQQLREA